MPFHRPHTPRHGRAVLALALLSTLAACGAAGGAVAGAVTAMSSRAAGRPTLVSALGTAPPTVAARSTVAPTAALTPIPATAAPTPSPSAPSCSTAGVLATWSVDRLAEQVVVVPINEGVVSAITAEVAAGAGGVILFGNVAPGNLGARLAALDSSAPGGIAPLVMTDEEGGAVQRMANLVGSVPTAREMGATMTPAQIRALAAGLARRMRAASVTMDLAPVLDVDGGMGPSATNADGTRSFSDNPATAAADGLAFAAGLTDGGVVPVEKHFPGLGGASGNTDVMRAATAPWSTLAGRGMTPFVDAIDGGAPALMVANATIPGLTALPASLSPALVTGILRERLGYRGLIMTDSLSATAVSAAGYSVPAAAVAALAAGADMVLYSATVATVAAVTQQTVAALVSAVQTGHLDRARLTDAVTHILQVKGVDLCRG